MRGLRFKILLILLVSLLLFPAGNVVAQDDALREDLNFARDKVYTALVNISVVTRQFSGGRAVRGLGAGSGVIVSPGGHVITNFHVAGNCTRIACTLTTGETIEADVIVHDPLTDISILKLRMEQRANPNLPLPFATLGNSDALKVGDPVLAMGNPLALSSTMTLGIVANESRVFTNFAGTELNEIDLGQGQKTGLFTQWIQHDALILPGNSGGPLVNLKGEVVGINELGGSGMGFAIPSNLVRKVLNQALAFGAVRRSWFGVSVLPVKKLGRRTGALISSVQRDGPAERAGLRPGDVILKVGTTSLDLVELEQIPTTYRILSEFTIGREVPVEFLRDGERRTARVKVAEMEEYLGDEEEFRTLGISGRDITSFMAIVRRFPSTDGVLVTGVRPGHPAEEAEPKINSGDVLLKIGDETITDRDTLRKVLESLEGEDGILVHLRRGDEEVYTVLDLSEKGPERGGGELPKPWVGVKTQVLTSDVAKALFDKRKRGFRVTQVFPWTEAAKVFRPGDIITHLDGRPLRASRVQDASMFRRRIEDYTIGEVIEVRIIRNKKTQTVDLKLEETPSTSFQAESAQSEEFEFAVREIAFMDRIQRDWDKEKKGVLVTTVASGSWAQIAGLRFGDLIRTIGDQAVTDTKSFEKAMRTVLKERPRWVKIFVERRYGTAFVFIEPDWSKIDEPKEKSK